MKVQLLMVVVALKSEMRAPPCVIRLDPIALFSKKLQDVKLATLVV